MSDIEHDKMVNGLAKCGLEIIADLTKDSAHTLHMAVGIAGEAGELCQAIYSIEKFELIDKENIVEELGDLEFYIEGLRQVVLIGRAETIKDVSDSKLYNGDIVCAKDNAVMLNIESSILLDYVKKSAFYVKPLSVEKVIVSLTKINEHMRILRRCFGFTRSQTISHNIDKLGKRYKGHNYSNEQAISRNDK